MAWVPPSFWRALFIPPTSFGGVLENVALGVAAGGLSFIGSIGIVPFAAALWLAGVSFGGAIGCVVSDLITVPVIALWREFMGARATAYIVAVFYVSMVATALAVNYLFAALGWLPHPNAARGRLVTVHLRLDYTLVLVLVFLAMALAL